MGATISRTPRKQERRDLQEEYQLVGGQGRVVCRTTGTATLNVAAASRKRKLQEPKSMKVLELSRLQDVHDELKRKTEEVETLKKALANFKGSRVEFFKDLSSAKKIKRKPRAKKPLFKLQAPTYEYLLSFIKNEPDDENDPDWCPNSERSQASRKRKLQEPKSMKRSTSAAACKCRGLCCSGRCGCSRKQRSCSCLCSCKGECRVAQHSESDLAIPEDTLTESLPEKQLSLRSKQ
ncbi:uncharacterized protein [Dermacentor albipictus]|uniref:uncharacterized protein n=1 Tax=Dermacentor albipictus TaxID=60249 RepID=UPI0038FC696A